METRNYPLYSEGFEHDACGIGAVVSIDGLASHSIVNDALSIVERLEHRAGKDATGEVGDGVGVLLQISHKFFSRLGLPLGKPGDYGVGMFFFPQDSLKRRQAQKLFEVICSKEGVKFLLWRQVPVNGEILGRRARETMPAIWQCFVERPEETARGLDFDRKLYVIRRVFEQSNDETYVCSFSSRTLVYKGMFLVHQLRQFYPDLQQEAIAVFGQDPRIYQTTVEQIHTNEAGQISSIQIVHLEPKPENGRMSMVEVPGSEEELPCDLLLIAAGFVGCESYVAESFQLPRDSRGSLLATDYRTPGRRYSLPATAAGASPWWSGALPRAGPAPGRWTPSSWATAICCEISLAFWIKTS